jgi:hypothetical protein
LFLITVPLSVLAALSQRERDNATAGMIAYRTRSAMRWTMENDDPLELVKGPPAKSQGILVAGLTGVFLVAITLLALLSR